jgi:tetratricopeptide (TPR) repeat protein
LRITLLVIALLIAAPSFAQPRTVTFNRDIAPIVLEQCASCHQPGEVAPFDLVTYRDVRPRAAEIARVTASRLMPPWKPAPGGLEFVGSRALTEEQIRLIQEWVSQGAVEGPPVERPALPPEPASGRWRLGTPDLIVTMAEPYALKGDGADAFRTFVMDIPLPKGRYVRALEFRPGNPRAVHHANIGIDRTLSSRRLDEADPEPGYFGGIVPDADYPPGQMLGWTPGQRPRQVAPGLQWRLDPGSHLVVQLHLHPTGKPESVQASVGFYFTDEPPTRTPIGVRLGSQTIDIAPDNRQYLVSDGYTLPVPVDVTAIQPHAHNLARRMEAVARMPDGTTRSLISIQDWDFRWQEIYYLKTPLVLPQGTTIFMRYVYDNSAGNPRNPNRPPQRIVWGQNTENEMGDLWVQIVPRNEDLAVLKADVSRKMREQDLAAHLVLLKSDPGNSVRHDTVGIFYLESGRYEEAIAAFRESLRLKADSAATHYNLGLSLSNLQRVDEASREFAETLRIDPAHADAHNSLGAMYHSQRRLKEAVEHYRQAVSVRSDHVGARTNLAWILAAGSDESLRNPADAIRVAEEAVALTRSEVAGPLDVLAAAYAALGQFERAVATAQQAAGLATAAGDVTTAAQIRLRIGLYQKSRPFKLP